MLYFSMWTSHFAAFLNSLFSAKPLALFLGVRKNHSFIPIHVRAGSFSFILPDDTISSDSRRLSSVNMNLVIFPSHTQC